MNTSPDLILLLIHFLTVCHGEEQTHSNAPSILATRKTQTQTESHLAVSCPDPTDIEPCVCTNDGRLTMDCRYIQGEEQLWQVFSAYFPSTAFYKFSIDNFNEGLQVLENGVFHNVSFEMIYIKDSALRVVENGALTPSLSTLTSIDIECCQLVTFPFESLPEFTSLKSLHLGLNHIPSIPPLSSSTLVSLGLDDNPISSLPPDVFKGLPAIQLIFLSGCQLTELTPGIFKNLPDLKMVFLYNNWLSYLQSLTFDIVSSPDDAGYINLGVNNIDFVEVDAFEGVQEFSKIDMVGNALTRLPERVWRPVLEKGINVTFLANPLTCGCDVAWLVRNPQLLTGAQDARCADGKDLADLDPADFSMCG